MTIIFDKNNIVDATHSCGCVFIELQVLGKNTLLYKLEHFWSPWLFFPGLKNKLNYAPDVFIWRRNGR